MLVTLLGLGIAPLVDCILVGIEQGHLIHLSPLELEYHHAYKNGPQLLRCVVETALNLLWLKLLILHLLPSHLR